MGRMGPRALLSRLGGMDRRIPRDPDRPRVAAAFKRHFQILSIPPLPIHWVGDLVEGFAVTRGRPWWGWQECIRKAGGAIDVDLEVRPICLDYGEPVVHGRARVLWSAAETLVRERARAQSRTDSPFAAWNNPTTAAQAAWHTVLAKAQEVWSPFIDAFKAGLWAFWIDSDGGRVVAVPPPVLRFRDRFVLHAEDGPAIRWPGAGTATFYFLAGVEVPKRVVLDPASLSLQDVVRMDNTEVRRLMISRYGVDRFLRDSKAVKVHEDRCGALYRTAWARDLLWLRVVNSTPESDGSRKEYFLSVPPWMESAHQAAAWTFGLETADYRPISQS